MEKDILIGQLNAPTKAQWLDAAAQLEKLRSRSGDILPARDEGYTNNHVYTTYSSPPYSPSKAVYMR